MELLSAKSLKGTWGTLLLPVNADNSIDYGGLENQLDFLISSGLNGIYSNGTAGEFFNQTEGEFNKIQVLLAEKCNKNKVAFQVGVSHMSPVISLERIERSKQLQPGAFQVAFPDWLPLTVEEQFEFLKRISEIAYPVPLVLYNPGHAKTLLQPKDFATLKQQIPTLIGIKAAAKGREWFDEMKLYKKGLSVFIQGHYLATGVKEGVATGSYSNIACFNPAGAVAWYRLMKEDINEALEVEKRIATFFATYIFPFAKAGYTDPALDKLLAFAGGWCSINTRLRWPYKGISEEEAITVKKAAAKHLPAVITKIEV